MLVAYYYAWYDANTWSSGATRDFPARLYDSADPLTIQRHIRQAQRSGIDAFNVAWLGPQNPTDRNLTAVLNSAERVGFRVSVGFETDSEFLRSRADVVAALRYAIATHSQHPAYLKYDGRPVIFFWRLGGIPTDGAASALEAWRQVRREVDPDGATLWIGEGDRFEYLQVFDGIHPYSIAWAGDVRQILSTYASRTRQQQSALRARKLWVATVMPGYDDRLTGRPDGFARERGGLRFYEETWAAAVASNPELIMITSWNEWVEGSQIEPSQAYGERYLDATLALSTRWKGPPREPPVEVLVEVEREIALAECIEDGQPAGDCDWVAEAIAAVDRGPGRVGGPVAIPDLALPAWVTPLAHTLLGWEDAELEQRASDARERLEPLTANPVIGLALVGAVLWALWQMLRR